MAKAIDYSEAKGIIPEKYRDEIIQGTIKNSVALRLFKKLRNMTSFEENIPVLEMLPQGGWVGVEENFEKPLTTMMWGNKKLKSEEYAARLIVRDSVLKDSKFNIWGEAKHRFQEDFGVGFDKTVFTGVNRPGEFPADIITSCINAGAVVSPSGNIMADLDKAMTMVEKSGFNANALIAGLESKSLFRMFVDSTGQPINGSFVNSLQKEFIGNGAWDSKRAKMIVVDFSQAMYSYREDMQFAISNVATTKDETGNIISTFDENKTVMKSWWKIGFIIPNPLSKYNEINVNRFPFAIIAADPELITYAVTFTLTSDGTTPIAKLDKNKNFTVEFINFADLDTYKIKNIYHLS